MGFKKLTELEKSRVEIEFTLEKEAFDSAVDRAFKKNSKNINIPGFRKGKAPRHIIEKMYGTGVFYEDAINDILPEAYENAVKESGAKTVGRAEFDVASIDENGVTMKAVVAVKPVVTLKEYKGLQAVREIADVTADEVNEEIKRAQTRNSRTIDINDRPAQMGDITNINYLGSVDGVPFDGGKGEDFNLTLGSGQFIPGFEEQIVGHNNGDEFDVNVTFPEDYHAKELAGKAAVFATKINQIKFNELPELDDEFAKDVSEFDTFEEYKKSVKKTLKDQHTHHADHEVDDKLMDALLENFSAEIPSAMFDVEKENMVRDYDSRLRMQGLDLSTYLKYTGMDLNALREQFAPQAEKQVKTRLALEKVAELENLQAEKEDLDKEFADIAKAYNIDVEEVKKQIPEDMLAEDIKVRKAVEFVKANAVITDKKKTAKKTTAAKTENGEKSEDDKKTTTKKTTTTTKKTTTKKATEKKEG